MSTIQEIRLAHTPESMSIIAALFKDVTNASYLRAQLVNANAEFEYAFLDASMIISTTHILAAAFRAINDMGRGRLKSCNFHSEIVFSLSPNNNIAESFRRFGIRDDTKHLLAIKVSTSPTVTKESVAKHLTEAVKGVPVEFEDAALAQITDLSYLIKVYKLNNDVKKFELQRSKVKLIDVQAENQLLRKHLEHIILGIISLKGW